ncbi:Predicted methyltransferase [Parasphingorhabdus marina DSM 22363]|uniref:Predicted methyltransferase n=1 Tax=Parasphingorhabdus marina DSM 22363 TaxID=1123272 RepID=A0A1N6GBM5_9SPHN|nr:class I SAM-dependent methyltransferase [Parasphingorhabdus marina]SIO04925.1 Predicted methyltransferase [Parasphingorhabdus marina DSM 22363]
MKKTLTAMGAFAAITLATTFPASAKDHDKGEAMQTGEALAAIVAHERRGDDKARDKYRNPVETLTFFGVKPTDTVVEYVPGGGWYSKILAPYVAEKGKYIGLTFAPDPLPFGDEAKERIRGFPAKFPNDVAGWTGMPAGTFSAYTADNVPEDVMGTADFVIIPRMMHNLMRWNLADSEIKVMRSMLKDGGTLGIVQHRAKDDAPFSFADGNKGYLHTAAVVNFMEAHGFELVKQSEINANPKDTADYPKGVWTLPPRYAEGDVDKAKYTAIGESDRMTLLFRKLP